jgi:hypothetical protein
MERSVIMWVSNTTLMNQEFSLFGLYIIRVFTRIGGSAVFWDPSKNVFISWFMIRLR